MKKKKTEIKPRLFQLVILIVLYILVINPFDMNVMDAIHEILNFTANLFAA